MTKFAGILLSANILMTLGSATPALPATDVEQDASARLTVRIYNYAKVHPATLEGVKRVAGQLFRQAGIETTWLHCALNEQELIDNSACEREFGPDSLLIRIVPERMARKLSSGGSELGFAILSEHDSFETEAYAFYDRAKELAETRIASITIVLGHVLAHEMGHLLLGVGQHSSRGLMKASWKEKELRLASIGGFGFSPKQARRIRRDAGKRLAAGKSQTD